MASNIVDKSDYRGFYSFLSSSLLPILILAVVALIIYAQTYSYDYVLDDKIVIADNAYVKKGISGWGDILSTESFQGYFGEQKNLVQGARYRPFSIMTFALEHQFFGLNPSLGHVINLLLYIWLCILIYRLFSLLFQVDAKRTWYTQISFWTALLFCVHPIHTEVVANIKGRDEIFVLLFMVLALIQGIKYFDLKKNIHLIWVLLFTFLALLSKENAIALPLLIPMTLFVFRKAELKKMLSLGSLIIIPVMIYLFLRYSVVGYLFSDQVITDVMNNPFYGMSLGDKYATVLYTLGYYLKLLILPFPLTHDYYPYHIPIMSWSSIAVWAATLTHIALLLYAIVAIFKRKKDAYFILFYLGTLFIVSNLLISVGTFMNERFLFVPSLAFCGWLIWRADTLAQYPKFSKLARSMPLVWAALVVCFGLMSFSRVPAWKNTLSLNRAAISVSKNSARANLFMGTALFNKYKDETDRTKKKAFLDESAIYIYRAAEILPSYSTALKMKAGIFAERFKVDRKINILLDGFADIVVENPGNRYIHEYLEYLTNQGIYTHQLEQFYLDAGYNKLFIQKNDRKWSQHFLNMGLKINSENPMLNYATGYILKQSGQASGNNFISKARQIDPSIDQKFGK